MFDHYKLASDAEWHQYGEGITLEMVAHAIFVWMGMNGQDKVSIADAAMTFNTTARLICDAVSLNPEASIRPEFETDPTKQFITLEADY